jgi:hypothetical protein
MPQSEEEWMTCTTDNLILRRSAYWISLRGKPDVENTTAVTIKIPEENRFDVYGLRTLMEASRSRLIR